jgi:hypothetical protein
MSPLGSGFAVAESKILSIECCEGMQMQKDIYALVSLIV